MQPSTEKKREITMPARNPVTVNFDREGIKSLIKLAKQRDLNAIRALCAFVLVSSGEAII
jgi:hypothetical protein